MEMGKFSKIISILLALIFAVTPVFAVPGIYLDREDVFVFYESEGTKVDGYQTNDGTLIFRQYVNGELVQRNTIRPTAPDVIEQEFFGAFLRKTAEENTIFISDYVTAQVEPSVTPLAVAPYQVVGTVNYRTILNNQEIFYGLRCLCQELVIGDTTYTINGYVGTVVTLVSILVGALNLPEAIASLAVARILASAGVTVTGGLISSAFTDTVSCVETDYNWKVTDTTASAHTKDLVKFGAKYYITDSYSDHRGETYYDGYLPSDWGEQTLAIALHTQMFSYSSYDVVSWTTEY